MTTPNPTTPAPKPDTTRHHIREVPGRVEPLPKSDRDNFKPLSPAEHQASHGHRVKKPRKSRAKSTRVTKVSQVIDLLNRPQGATMAEIAADIGWKEDSLRGFFAATLKGKKRLTLVSAKESGRGRVYRIAAQPSAEADSIEEAI